LDGLKVPDVIVPELDTDPAASSSSVSSTPFASLPPPASERMIAVAPVGPMRSASMSSGLVWPSPLSVRSTSVIELPRPEIVQLDG
jgi:hypothetical protein